MITQGKWLVSSSVIICDQTARIIANCMPVEVPSLSIDMTEAIDNARLIAAAPALLEACTDCLGSLKSLAKHRQSSVIDCCIGTLKDAIVAAEK